MTGDLWRCRWIIRTHEEVVRIGVRSSDSEELHKVVELSVDITTYCNWASLRVSSANERDFDDMPDNIPPAEHSIRLEVSPEPISES